MFRFFLMIVGVVFSVDGYSHSGGLDSSGCHGGSQPYHCHRAPSEMVTSSSGQNRLKCSAGSRSQDCIGTNSTNNYQVPSSLSYGQPISSSDTKVSLISARDTNWRRIIPREGYSGYESFVFTTNDKFFLNIKSSELSNQTKARMVSESHKCKLTLSSGSYDKVVSQVYAHGEVTPSFFFSLDVAPNTMKTFEHFDKLYLDCGWFEYIDNNI